jgi:hypothetical protein
MIFSRASEPELTKNLGSSGGCLEMPLHGEPLILRALFGAFYPAGQEIKN